jgi:signal transduction histidine kinase
VVRPDGTEIVVHARAEARRGAGGRLRLLGTCQDVTDRKRAEDEVRRLNAGLEAAVRERTAELEGALREMGSFSHAVAHDLRAPLRSMHGLGEILLMEYPGRALDARGADYLRRIQTASRRMDALLQDLLAYGRLARAEIPLEPIRVGEVAEEVVSRFSGELRERRAQVALAAEPAVARGNRGLLEQALANLLSNAMKFVVRGVEPRVRIAVERRGGRVRVSVSDNGIGIAAEHHERIFGVFQQLHSRGDYPGTGIGLALARRGVERMGGRMGVESAPGRGSTFWFELPAVDDEPSSVFSGSAGGSDS